MAPIQFGILMIPYQTIDVAGPVDILFNSSKALFESLDASGLLPPGLLDKALDIEFHYIGDTMNPVTLTGNARALPTVTCDECPALDYLLVGGPDPVNYRLSRRFIEFLQAYAKTGNVMFTTCTGGLCVAEAGILDGKSATTNHEVLQLAQMRYPQVQWKKEQWVVDGQFWTAGGACTGMDMIAHWVIEKCGMELAKFGFGTLDYEPRDLVGNRVLPQQHGVKVAN